MLTREQVRELRKEKADHDAITGGCACRICALTPYLDTIEAALAVVETAKEIDKYFLANCDEHKTVQELRDALKPFADEGKA